jgi:hypothetical protein
MQRGDIVDEFPIGDGSSSGETPSRPHLIVTG